MEEASLIIPSQFVKCERPVCYAGDFSGDPTCLIHTNQTLVKNVIQVLNQDIDSWGPLQYGVNGPTFHVKSGSTH